MYVGFVYEMARPTDYTPELLEKANQYLLSCEDEEIERGSDERPTYKIRVKLPTIEGLARFIDVHRDTLYEWAKIHPEFSDILESIKAEQANKLINNGLSGDYNPTIAKLLLTKHGYSDKIEQDLTSGGEKLNIINYGDSKSSI
jgi:hypothetical protein